MTEMLHWYAETSGGVQTGNCTVTENGGALHLSADLPAEKLSHAKKPGSFQGTPGFFLSFCCKMSALSWQNAENAETA